MRFDLVELVVLVLLPAIGVAVYLHRRRPLRQLRAARESIAWQRPFIVLNMSIMSPFVLFMRLGHGSLLSNFLRLLGFVVVSGVACWATVHHYPEWFRENYQIERSEGAPKWIGLLLVMTVAFGVGAIFLAPRREWWILPMLGVVLMCLAKALAYLHRRREQGSTVVSQPAAKNI